MADTQSTYKVSQLKFKNRKKGENKEIGGVIKRDVSAGVK